jgi:hypothetical protein
MKLTNTYLGGIDRDLSIVAHQNNTLYDCRNMRILTDEGLSTSSLENVKGTTELKDFTDGTYENFATVGILFPDARYVGSCVIRDINVIFTTESESGGTDQIWEMMFDRTTNTYKYWLRYHGDLGLSTEHPIYRSVGRYESTEAVKVYWTDNNNVLRHVNVRDYDTGTGLLNIPDTSFFEIKNNAELSQPNVESISGGGKLKSGMIQYCYEYFNKYSSTSFYSPLSDLIHLTASSEYKSNSWTYIGSDIGDDVFKSIRISISPLDTRYNYIRVYSFFYAEVNSTPVITLIAEKDISGTSISVVDTGTESLDILSYPAYVARRNQEDFICKGLTEYKNMIFPANIDEVEWDVDYDARAFRFRLPNILYDFAPMHIYTPGLVPTCVGEHANVLVTIPGGTDAIITSFYDTGFPAIDSIEKYHQTYDETVDEQNISVWNRCLGFYPNDWRWKADRAWNTMTLGGTGINVSYSFKIKRILLDSQNAATRTYATKDNTLHTVNDKSVRNTSYTNMASPYISGLFRGYQRGEIYSFGIVFYDLKGRSSWVKWIGDIKMPTQDDVNDEITFSMNGIDYYDYRMQIRDSSTGFIYGNILYPEFGVNIPAALSSQISRFEIVRCKRNDVDRTVIGYGPLVNSHDTGGGWYAHSHTTDIHHKLIYNIPGYSTRPKMFYCPERVYNKNLVFSGGDYMIVDGISSVWVSYYSGVEPATGYTYNTWDKIGTITPISADGTLFNIINRWNGITDAKQVDENGAEVIDGQQFRNWIAYGSTISEPGCGNGVSNMPLNISTLDFTKNLGILPFGYDGWGLFGWYKRKNGIGNISNPQNEYQYSINIYNGETYYDRVRRTYISCGAERAVTTDTGDIVYYIKVFGGDVFVSMHEQMLTTFNIPNSDTVYFQRAITYAAESTINCDLCMGSTITKGETVGSGGDPGFYQEKKGIYTFPSTAIYTQSVDMYVYNSVYSHENDSNEFLPEPLHYVTERLDCEIRFSNQKYDRELVDSWTLFDSVSFNNVSSEYGAITDVLSWKDKFVFFQPNAIGLYSVNERSLIADQSGQQLSLGSSGVLERYDYISYDAGTRLQGSTIATNNAIYFFNDIKRRISKLLLSSGGVGVTEIPGLNSFLYYNYAKDIENDDCTINDTKYGISSGWNKRFEEVYFTFKNNALFDNYTIAINEITGKFMAAFDFYAGGYINSNNGFLSLPNFGTSRGQKLYLHDSGDYGNYYGTVYNSLIKFITTYKGMIGVFDNIEYQTEVFSYNPLSGMYDLDVFNATYSEVRVNNDYQDSGDINLVVDSTVMRRMRMWRISEVLRDDLDEDPRMRDKYMMSRFIFDNTDNYRLVSHPIDTYVRIHGM